MASVRKHLPLLQSLQNSKPKIRKQILKKADASLINTLLECINNVLIGNVPLNKTQKDKLKRYKNILRKLVQSNSSFKEKKNLIVQSGGAFLPALLVPIITAAISHYLTK